MLIIFYEINLVNSVFFIECGTLQGDSK